MSGDLAVAAALDGVVVEGLGVGELILGLANTPEPRAETAMSRQLGAEQLEFRGNVGHRDNERLQQSTAVLSKPRDFMPSVEWETLLFFAGMLVMIGALENTGVITQLAEALPEPVVRIRSPRPWSSSSSRRPQRNRRQHFPDRSD